MSLRPCKECLQQISSDAKVCPQRGKKQSTNAGVGCLVLIGLLILLGAINWLNGRHGSNASSPAEQAAKQREDVTLGRAIWGAQQLRKSARNPHSFKLAQALIMADGTACYTYRAQNGFGGMDVGYAALTATLQFKTDDMSGFRVLWKERCANKTGADKTREVVYGLVLRGITSDR